MEFYTPAVMAKTETSKGSLFSDAPGESTEGAPNMHIRLESREVDPSGWGADAVLPQITHLREGLEAFLVDNGYKRRRYIVPPGQEEAAQKAAEADDTPKTRNRALRPSVDTYFKHDPRFRHEAVLIDEGGRTVGGRPVLSIAVRDPQGENRDLFIEVSRMVALAGIHPIRSRRMDQETMERIRPDDIDTEVFRIRRLPHIGFGGSLVQSMRDALLGLIPRPTPAFKLLAELSERDRARILQLS